MSCEHCSDRGGKMWESPRSQPWNPTVSCQKLLVGSRQLGDSRWNRIWSQRSFEDIDYFDCIHKRAYLQTNSLIVQTQILFNVVHLPGYHVVQNTMSLFAFERAAHLRAAYPGRCSEGHLLANDSLQLRKITVRLDGSSASSTSSPSSSSSSIIMHHHVSRIQGRYQTSVWSTSNCYIVASQFCRRIALSISNFIWGLHSLILWDLRSILHSLSLRCASHKWGWPSQIEGTCLQKSFFLSNWLRKFRKLVDS